MQNETYGVVANVAQHPKLRLGARVTVTQKWTGGAHERVQVRGLSKRGRRIEIWIAAKNLKNARAAWIRDGMPCNKEKAQRDADLINQYRSDINDG